MLRRTRSEVLPRDGASLQLGDNAVSDQSISVGFHGW